MPSVSEEASSSRLERYGYTILSGLVTKSDNIDISPNGQLVLLSEETLYILTPAVGFSPLLKPSGTIRSHHDPDLDLPLFDCFISIKDCPQDVSRAGSGREAYLLAYEPRFLDAKWGPHISGPNASPILAALTTQSQIVLFTASTNQFTGPWKVNKVLNGGTNQHVTSIAWLKHDEDHTWLIAGTRKGCILSWLMQGDKVIHTSSHQLLVEEIVSLYWSKAKNLAIVTSSGIYIAGISRAATSLDIRIDSLRPQLPPGSCISIAHWHGSQLAYCTPGQVHVFDSVSGKTTSVLLENAEDDALSCSMRPAAAIKYDVDIQAWTVRIQDGSDYHLKAQNLLDENTYIRPPSFLAPANEAIRTLQRTVEAMRGLFSMVEDGAGLTFLCHDANSIASWSYFRDPRCQFELCVTEAPRQSQELQIASNLILAALQGGVMELRALIVYYSRSSKKAEWATLIMHSLERAAKERTTLQAAIRLSAWIQREQIKEVKDRTKSLVHSRLLDLAIASILLGNVIWLLTSPDDASTGNADASSDSFGKLNCKIAEVVAERTNDDALRDAAAKLKQTLQHRNAIRGTNEIDIEESCPACASKITKEGEVSFQARCSNGHFWKRCSSTFTILPTSYNMICSICSRESTRKEDASNRVQSQLLSKYKSCRMCDGKLVI